MDRAFLEELGLDVREDGGVVEAELELTSGQAVNPLTRKFVTKAQFTVLGDRLITIDPWEFIIGTDRLGNFRVLRAANDGVDMTTTSAHSFELSEFRERSGLEHYLVAMFGDTRPSSIQDRAPVDRSKVITEPRAEV